METTGYSKNRSAEAKNIAVHQLHSKPNQVGTVLLYGVPIVSLIIDSQERLCLAQISNTLLKDFSYNEIHNRRVALGITCVQCTPVQLEILRRAGAMPVSSRRCGMITRREAERLCKSFLGDNAPPRLPDDFAFSVHHECAWGCRGAFLPSRYNSSRAKCIKCTFCGLFFSPNKFIFHSHRTGPGDKYIQPDAANFNSWRRHMKLSGNPPDEIVHAWEDVKAMFNGGTRKRMLSTPNMSSSERSSAHSNNPSPAKQSKLQSESPVPLPSVSSPSPALAAPTSRVPPFGDLPLPLPRNFVMDYVWNQNQAAKQPFPFAPYSLPWLKRSSSLFFGHAGLDTTLLAFHRNAPILQEAKPIFHQSAFRPVQPLAIAAVPLDTLDSTGKSDADNSDDETVDIETTEDEARQEKSKEATATSFWNCLSPRRDEDNSTLSPGASDRTRSPIPQKRSQSPVILKLESDGSPPPLPPILPTVPQPTTYDSSDSHFFEPHKGSYADPPYLNPYKTRSPSPVSPKGFSGKEAGQREAPLWSVAKMSALDGDRRASDYYRGDPRVPRNSYMDSRVTEDVCDQQYSKSPIDCSACHARGQPLFSPGQQAENNNKLTST